ncbi:endonuclease [Bacteroidia bacterium]|nr:endonuclease [Bacteroidia bacterium]
MKPLKNLIWFIIKALNAIGLIALFLAAFSDYISPERSVIFSYLGLFFPFILAGNGIVFLAWLILKQWKMVLLNFLVMLACIASIHTYFPLHGKTKEIPKDAIKILTYNVMCFEWIKKESAKHPNEILQYIKESDADIVCIQEYGASKTKKQFLMEKDILKALEKYPYHYFQYLMYPSYSEVYGMALFSKFPILSSKKIPYESYYNGSFVSELDIRGKKVTLINNHLESNKLSETDRSRYYQMTKDIDSHSLNIFTQIMSERLTPAYKIRARQAQLVSKVIEENKNPYIIVCGDFNDTPISYVRHKIKGNLLDAFAESGRGLGITYNKNHFLFRIDYILHSDNIQSYNCTVGKLKNSDHYPLWCYLELK